MKELTIKNYQGINVTESREVAEMIGKAHDKLLRDIRGYIEIISHSPKLESENFFIESEYLNSRNQKQPCYLLTKQGCEMVANKMTGEKGILFTAEYVQAFNKMEQHIPKMSKELQAIFMIDGKTEELKNEINGVKKDLEDFKDNAPLFNSECDELMDRVKSVATKILGYKTPAYNDKSLRGRVYSDMQHQLRREFGVKKYKAIKRCQLSKAFEIVNNYVAPTVLIDEITRVNNQVSFEEAM